MVKNFFGKILDIQDISNDKDIVYFVQDGESVYSVADKFAVPVAVLRRDNKLGVGDNLSVGDLLFVAKRNKGVYIVKPAETLTKIAQKLGVNVQHLVNLNGVENVYIGQKLVY